jgi:protein TonB
VPPSEVAIAPLTSAPTNTITVTSEPPKPKEEPPKIQHQPVRVAPVLDAAHSCRQPEYPAASRRQEEQGGVVLSFLINESGRVVESKVERSSGYSRLDEAARVALSLCQFKPGSLDGKPESSWAKLEYVWRLE